MEITVGIVTKVNVLGKDKYQFITKDNGEYFSKDLLSPPIGERIEIAWRFNSVGTKKIVQYWTSTKGQPELVDSTALTNTLAIAVNKESLLKAIWASPALATQPGNSDEMPKIAIKWAEESIEWLQK